MGDEVLLRTAVRTVCSSGEGRSLLVLMQQNKTRETGDRVADHHCKQQRFCKRKYPSIFSGILLLKPEPAASSSIILLVSIL